MNGKQTVQVRLCIINFEYRLYRSNFQRKTTTKYHVMVPLNSKLSKIQSYVLESFHLTNLIGVW